MTDEFTPVADENTAVQSVAEASIATELVAEAPVVQAFPETELHAQLRSYIDTFGGFATARMHQLVDELNTLFRG